MIGLTSRTVTLRAATKQRPTETVTRTYVTAIEEAGGLPLILPTPSDPALATRYIAMIDGLLLTGGDDPHPRLFDEAPHPNIEVVDERRDVFEVALVRAAHARGLAVLGICRGVQMMNIALGGDIYQDIPSQSDSRVCHSQRTVEDGPWHDVAIAPDSLLARLVGPETWPVNSFHHQACRRLGVGLRICATTHRDGLIEAIEDPHAPFFLGVQWHPELGAATGESRSEAIFRGFIGAARESGAKASNVQRVPSEG